MKVDYVLILAAGKGTRMGELGKKLPKVIWPIFNRSILSLEVDYAKTFSPKKIFINTFNYADKVIEHVKSLEDEMVFVLEEKEELDIGGAVHNLAKNVDYQGSLLIINSDQFLTLSDIKRATFFESFKNADSVLLTYKVKPKDGYNALNINDKKEISGITLNKDCLSKEEVSTYIGMSLVHLESLERVSGKSRFFDSVVSFKKHRVLSVDVSDTEYWDFGTLERYKKSIRELVEIDSEFKKFLKNCQVKIPKSEGLELKINESFSLKGEELIFR